jgi:hypothetical protein
MNPWLWILIGFVAFPVALAALVLGVFGVWCLGAWLSWKNREFHCRREWTQENPYWREAFEAGAKWACEGESRAEPNLTRLRMPKGDANENHDY